jgi:hypothetical protein
MRKTILLLFLLFNAHYLLVAQTATEPFKYPLTKKVDQMDNYFGTKVYDPYR